MTPPVTVVDAGGLILRVEAAEPADAELVRRVIGSAPTDAAPHAALRIGGAAPSVPTRPPDFAGPYGNHWDDGTTHWFAHDWGLAVQVTSGEAVLGGPVAGYRRWVAVRNSMLFVLARLLLAQDRFLLHGAAVRHDEHALLVVGESGTGKSSLTYAAHLSGWRVLGDDMVAVETSATGVSVRGIPRVPTIPGDVAQGAGGEPLPHDPRARLELPEFELDRRPATVSGLLICRHDDGAGQLAVAAATEAVEALVPAFVLSALPLPVTRSVPAGRPPRARARVLARARRRRRRATGPGRAAPRRGPPRGRCHAVVNQPGPNVLCRRTVVDGTLVASGGSMRFHRSSAVTWELVDERAVILDADGSTLTTLNPVGTLIWRHLDQPREPAELGADLADRFPSVDRRQLESDTGAFLEHLVHEGLVIPDAA